MGYEVLQVSAVSGLNLSSLRDTLGDGHGLADLRLAWKKTYIIKSKSLDRFKCFWLIKVKGSTTFLQVN